MSLIKLTPVGVGEESFYVNPHTIATAQVRSGGKTTITTTELQRNNEYTVIETPSEIISLMEAAEVTDKIEPDYGAIKLPLQMNGDEDFKEEY